MQNQQGQYQDPGQPNIQIQHQPGGGTLLNMQVPGQPGIQVAIAAQTGYPGGAMPGVMQPGYPQGMPYGQYPQYEQPQPMPYGQPPVMQPAVAAEPSTKQDSDQLLIAEVRQMRSVYYNAAEQDKLITTRAHEIQAKQKTWGTQAPENLLKAIRDGKIADVKTLIINANLNLGGRKWNRPSYATSMDCNHPNTTCNHFAIAQLVFDNGADVNKGDDWGYTPAYLAVYWTKANQATASAQLDQLKTILKYGGTVSNVVKDDNGNNPNGTKEQSYSIQEWAFKLDQPAKVAAMMKFAIDFDVSKLDKTFLAKTTKNGRTYAEVARDAVGMVPDM